MEQRTITTSLWPLKKSDKQNTVNSVSITDQPVTLERAPIKRTLRKRMPSLYNKFGGTRGPRGAQIPPPLSMPEQSALKQYTHALQQLTTSAKDIAVSFHSFPYPLHESLQSALIHSSHVALQQPELLVKRQYSAINKPVISLFGPRGTELYQEQLCKALAKHHNAVFVDFDVERLDLKEQHEQRDLGGQGGLFEALAQLQERHKPDDGEDDERKQSARKDEDEDEEDEVDDERADQDEAAYFDRLMRRTQSRPQSDEATLAVRALFALLAREQGRGIEARMPAVVFIRNVSPLVYKQLLPAIKNSAWYHQRNTLPIVFVVSSIKQQEEKTKKEGEVQAAIFPLFRQGGAAKKDAMMDDPFAALLASQQNAKQVQQIVRDMSTSPIDISPPRSVDEQEQWKAMLENDHKSYIPMRNIVRLQSIFDKNNIQVMDGIAHDILTERRMTQKELELVVSWAMNHHAMTHKLVKELTRGHNANKQPVPLSSESISHAAHVFARLQTADPVAKKIKSSDLTEYEQNLLAAVVHPHEIDVTFNDIGALPKVKEALHELAILPMTHPVLFSRGTLRRASSGILLFGPPGTGKTMLAKAVAKESHATFINISMSSLTSKWYGDAEKYVSGLFSLARKLSPSIIFIDEVDSLLSARGGFEHEASRRMKNEFMAHWDGLKSAAGNKVLVMAATNRPFDLDDAVLRRLSRRLLVDLPDQTARVQILQKVLQHEELAADVDLNEIASKTQGYSGSDIKALCVAASYQAVRKFMSDLRQVNEANTTTTTSAGAVSSEYLRPLNHADFVAALGEVKPTVSDKSLSIAELHRWNELFGEGKHKPVEFGF
jgi:ATP-dependent 26S proteasome regulatory subunit